MQKEEDISKKITEKNGEPIDEHGEPIDEEPDYNGWDAMADILTNKELLSFLRESVDKIVGIIDKNKNTDENKFMAYEKSRRLFLWHRFLLSMITIAALGLSAAYKWLPSEAIIPLLGGVIASLFVTPKKD